MNLPTLGGSVPTHKHKQSNNNNNNATPEGSCRFAQFRLTPCNPTLTGTGLACSGTSWKRTTSVGYVEAALHVRTGSASASASTCECMHGSKTAFSIGFTNCSATLLLLIDPGWGLVPEAQLADGGRVNVACSLCYCYNHHHKPIIIIIIIIIIRQGKCARMLRYLVINQSINQ